jgi:SP family xylose:H+ symportor-like MFS transporter
MKTTRYLYGITAVTVLGGLLFGYDTAVISGAEQGLEAFFRGATDFDYTKVWHGITASSALIGCIVGGAISGLLASRLGRRNSLRLAALLFFLSALGSCYPELLFFDYGKPTASLLVAFNLYRILGGIGVGLASAICPMYIAEVAPANVRGRLVSCNQFAIIFGMLVVYFVNYLIRNHLPTAEAFASMGWRRMFVSEAFPAALFGLLLFCVPKTPRYLVLSGHPDAALAVLERINGRSQAATILADIKATARQKSEKLLSYGLGVIAIGILLSVFQQAVGINVVLYYAPRIFETMGATGDSSMIQTVVMGVVNIIFTVVAILTVDKFGRKPLLIIGSAGMMVGMVALSALSFMNAIGIAALVFIILYTASFMMSWGPICWVLISEIFPNTIRGKAVAIAVAAQWIANFTVSSTFPSLSAWSVGGTYMIYAVFSLLSAIFVWKMVPETKGKTLEDMSRLWRANANKMANDLQKKKG